MQPATSASAHPFVDLPGTPAMHFRLYLYGAVLHVFARVLDALGSSEAAFERFPFLVDYTNELAARGADGLTTVEAGRWWSDGVRSWEDAAEGYLPLRELVIATALDASALLLLVTIGLCEEDGGFGSLFETMQGVPGQRHPTFGLLNAWSGDREDAAATRGTLRRLQDLGLVRVVGADRPRAEWGLRVPTLLWDAMRGERTERPVPWLRYQPASAALDLDEVTTSDRTKEQIARLPALLQSGDVRTLIVRGAWRNGRRTLIRSIARALQRGVLEINGLDRSEDERWSTIGPLATLLNAVPVIPLDLASGETFTLPAFDGLSGPLAIALGTHGGVAGPGAEAALTVQVGMPEPDARRRHWQRGFLGRRVENLEAIIGSFRMTSGNIVRAARLAASYAALDGRDAVSLGDIRRAMRMLDRENLEALAVPIEVTGTWRDLAVSTQTGQELRHLELRCRHREVLETCAHTGLRPNAGVRALLSGPSGSGKTLAARLLAAVLAKELYRIDLAAVVNKYIGETEKRLDTIFSRAEELDVVLLLDEGDSLLTQRTSVQSSNDRYANLETNYLLQRLEAFQGILIVTTNAGDRIDDAFARRMDVVIAFASPTATERWAIWELHLPSTHVVPPSVLREIASRCGLMGGDIRNAVLHASLLALDDDGPITAAHLESAIHREYRKLGAVCPLRSDAAVRGG